IAAGIRARHHRAAELVHLLDGIDRDIARPRHHHLLPVERTTRRGQDLVDEEHRAIPGGLAAHLRSAPGQALTGEHTGLVTIGDALVLAEQITDLAPAHA